jgi:hypothetical protein
MNSHDHLPPHFHAEYAEHEAAVDIRTGRAIAGSLPNRALRLVVEWAELHRAELMENWRRCERAEPLSPIAPL